MQKLLQRNIRQRHPRRDHFFCGVRRNLRQPIAGARRRRLGQQIAQAIEEQGAATQEIARSVQQAAIGTTQVATSIADVNRGAGDTGSASSQVLSSAQLLSNENKRLKAEVIKFLATVRAA